MQFRPRLTKSEYELILKSRSESNDKILKRYKESPKAKILLFDIETSPFACYSFQKWGTNIGDNFILDDWNIISWSAKYLFEDEVHSMKITAKEQETRNDKRIVQGLWKMLDDCDILVAHNLKKFDKKVAQTRFFFHDLKMPSHYQEIDTLISARKQFKITSNRLDYIAQDFLGIEGKMQTEKNLWLNACGNPFKGIKPSQDAIDKMSIYCDQDVLVLEDVYIFLRPYITNHPNLALFIGSDNNICKACGHDEFESIGDYTTIVNIYDGFRCKNCGSVHRSKKAITQNKIALR
jgi:hypothetical protein